jgi:hypothetical protein
LPVPPRRPRRTFANPPAAPRPTSVGELIRATAPGKAKAEPVSRAIWEAVAGVVFARRTRPERLAKGKLYVVVASPSWAQELTMFAPTLIERLRAREIPVEEIRVRVGPIEAPDRGGVTVPARAVLAAAANVQAPPEALAPVAQIRDDKLREALAKTARAIARRDAQLKEREAAANPPRVKPVVPGRRDGDG